MKRAAFEFGRTARDLPISPARDCEDRSVAARHATNGAVSALVEAATANGGHRVLATDLLTALQKLETGRSALKALFLLLWCPQVDFPFAREPLCRYSGMRQRKNYDAHKTEVWVVAAQLQVNLMHPAKPANESGKMRP